MAKRRRQTSYCCGCGRTLSVKLLKYDGRFCTMKCAASMAANYASADPSFGFCSTCGELNCNSDHVED